MLVSGAGSAIFWGMENKKFIKFRFRGNGGATAGLVVEASKFNRMSVSDLSRLFPWCEASKMHLLDRSPEYSTWEGAFAHDLGPVFVR